jgi:pyridoxal phosphate enzyme (YggS family)
MCITTPDLREIMDAIGMNLQAVKQRIAEAAMSCGRDPQSVALIAVSKTFDVSAIESAYRHGQRLFGESYVQEALKKIAALPYPDLQWHFIGPIQSNKTRLIAEHFAWVHGVDRAHIAERLSAARPPQMEPLQVCMQVNIGGESTKSGIQPHEALALARAVSALPHLKVRGLMTVPPPAADPNEQRLRFSQLRQLLQEVTAGGIALDTLSMGMSDDLEAAVMEGATMVRVGTSIFGPRQRKSAADTASQSLGPR